MGEGIGLICPHCGKYELIINYGIGFKFYDFENPPSVNSDCWSMIKSKKILKIVDDLMVNKNGHLVIEEPTWLDKIFNENDNEEDDESDEDSSIKFGMNAYYSKSEKKIYNLIYFKIEYIEKGETKYYEPVYLDKNKEPLQLLTEDEVFSVEIKCPKCGKNINERSDDDDMFSAPMIIMYDWD